MFDNIDELFIDDENVSETDEYAVESGVYFDVDDMFMDASMEAFSYYEADDDETNEYFFAIESLLDSISTDLEAIAMEVSYAAGAAMIANDKKKSSLGAKIKSGAGAAFSKIKSGIAKVLDGVYSICKSRYNHLNGKGKDATRRGQFWYKMMLRIDNARNNLRGITSPEALKAAQKNAEEIKEAVDQAVKEDAASTSSPASESDAGRGKETIAQRLARNKAKMDREAQQAQREAQKKKNMNKNAVKGRVNRAKKLVEENKAKVRVTGNRGVNPNAVDSYIVEDFDNEYSVAVEGLFSKPKTAEALLGKMQKKVGRLKSIGACDDMIRQLNAEASKFNTALSALKKASSDFQQTNDKKALKAAAGPVLKDLNKTCKLLKIKNISSDPKNITQEEIAKLHDFIKGAKQLIVARKKVLSGAATESVLSGYEDDFEVANEGYEDDGDMMGFLSGDHDDFDDDYDDIEIADEALIEDFDEADQDIAIATEGIIDPDAKRAHRIKFGEKKRQIQSVVKKARQAKKAKDFAAAISLYQEAKKGFQGLLAEAKKIPDRATGAYNKAYAKGPTYNKTNLINWCIKKMGECDNAIEAIRNGQMKGERKAAAKEARAARKAAKKAAKNGGATESYLDSITEYEAVIESLGEDGDPDFDEDPFDDFDDDFEDTEDTSLESLMN